MTKQEQDVLTNRIATLQDDLDNYYNLFVYWKEQKSYTAMGAWALKIYQCTEQIEALETLQTLIFAEQD
jgi:predicted neuraminidase